jgi:putative addiction module antidote
MIRKFDARLRKVGNSYVITIPKDSVERFELGEGDLLAISFESDEIKKGKKEDKKK